VYLVETLSCYFLPGGIAFFDSDNGYKYGEFILF